MDAGQKRLIWSTISFVEVGPFPFLLYWIPTLVSPIGSTNTAAVDIFDIIVAEELIAGGHIVSVSTGNVSLYYWASFMRHILSSFALVEFVESSSGLVKWGVNLGMVIFGKNGCCFIRCGDTCDRGKFNLITGSLLNNDGMRGFFGHSLSGLELYVV